MGRMPDGEIVRAESAAKPEPGPSEAVSAVSPKDRLIKRGLDYKASRDEDGGVFVRIRGKGGTAEEGYVFLTEPTELQTSAGPKKVLRVDDAEIPETLRGKGIGQDLYRSALDEAVAAGYDGIYSRANERSADADSVWGKLGGEWVGENQVLLGRPAPTAPAEAALAKSAPAVVGEAEPSGSLTSIKNAVVNAERLERGVEPMVKPTTRKTGTVEAEARAIIAADPYRPLQLAAELARHPRPITDTEVALLDMHRVNLKRQRNMINAEGIRAAERGAMDAATEAHVALAKNEEAFVELERASQMAGTESARGLALRRMMAEGDSLIEMVARRRAENDNYRPLTPKQAAETEAIHARLAKATEELESYKAKVAEYEAGKSIDAALKETKRRQSEGRARTPASKDYGTSNRVFTRPMYEQTLANVRSRLTQLSAGLDPTLLVDMAKIGGFHLEAGLRSFAGWSRAMLKDLGDKARPHLREVWRASRNQFAAEIRAQTVEDMKKQAAEGQLVLEMRPALKRLTEDLVASGITEREALIDAVHNILREVEPSITRRETMDAISGYGRVTKLDVDPVRVPVRELRGQMQQVAKLEDMLQGKAPLLSGWERQVPGDIQREFIRKVNEAKKQGGYDRRDPRRQLQTALGAVKTRLKNQIRDLQKQITTRVKVGPERTRLEYDTEAQALRAERDALREQYDELFGRRGVTDEQRLNMAIKSTERSIAEYERRIREKDLFPTPAKRGELSDARLDANRAKLDALREELKQLQYIERPPKTLEQIVLQTIKTRLKREAADYQDKLARGDFTPKKKPTPVKRDAEAIRLEAQRDAAKMAWHEALLRDRMRNRSLAQKALAAALVDFPSTARAIMTALDVSAVLRQGMFLVAAHPIRSSKALAPMFRALLSAEAQQRSSAAIRLRTNYHLARQGGLFLSQHGTGKLSEMEEAYMSRYAGKIPLVAASQRAYVTFLDNLRMDAFDAMIAGLSRTGTPTPIEVRETANYINVATGRGHFGARASASAALNVPFFAPRFVASRFQLLLGEPLYRGSARTRTMVAKEYARFLAGIGVVYALGQLAGGDVETDPRSSDFGKLRFGDSRLDPLAGLAQTTVLLSRLGSGKTKTHEGKIVPIRGERPYTASDSAEVIGRFLRTKLSPMFGAGLDVLAGEDLMGEPATVAGEAQDLVTPMTLKDIYEAMKEQGVPKGTALGLLALFGMSLQTHKDRTKRSKAKSRAAPRK